MSLTSPTPTEVERLRELVERMPRVPVEQPYDPEYRDCPRCGTPIEVDSEHVRPYLTTCGGCSSRFWVRRGNLHVARY